MTHPGGELAVLLVLRLPGGWWRNGSPLAEATIPSGQIEATSPRPRKMRASWQSVGIYGEKVLGADRLDSVFGVTAQNKPT